MNNKSFLMFFGGIIVGGIVGIFGTKKYFEGLYHQKCEEFIKKYEDDAEALKNYVRMTDDYKTEDEEKDEEENESEDKEKTYDTVNYSKIYEIKEEKDEDEEVSETDLEAFEEHQKSMDKPPRIISAEAYADLPGYIDQKCLTFYAYDEALCDENDEPINEPELLIGDALTKYNFIDSEEYVIFVMNYSLDTCYEISKIDASWMEANAENYDE